MSSHRETRSLNRTARYGYLICSVIFLSYLLVYFHRVCPSVIALDMQAAFGVGGALLGVLGSAYFYPYAIMQFPVGVLADRWGPRKTVTSLMLLAALGSAIMGLTSDISWAITGRVLVGIGVSSIFVCNFKLVAEWFSPRHMVVIGGLFISVGGLGVLAASYPLALLSDLIGWDATLVLIGAATLVMALAVWLVVRDHPADKGLADPPDKPQTARTERIGVLAGIKEVLTSPRFVPLAVWIGFGNGMVFGFGSMWSVPYLQHLYDMSRSQASLYQSSYGVALLLGSPILSMLVNRIGRKQVIVGCSLVLAALFGLLYLAPQGLPPAALYLVFCGLFLAGTAVGPIMATVAKELFDPSISGTSVGLANCFPFFLGGVFQVAMGSILEAGGMTQGSYSLEAYQDVFLLCLLSCLVSLAAGLKIR